MVAVVLSASCAIHLLESVLLEYVGIIDVVFDGISDRIVPAHRIHLEVRFVVPPKALILSLLSDLLSDHQLLLFLPLGVHKFCLHLSPPVLSHCLNLLAASLVILHLAVFLHLQLLHQSVFHHLALLLFPASILILRPEKRLSAIQASFDVLIEAFSALFIVILEKTAASLFNLQGLSVFTKGLEWDQGGLQIGCGRILVKIALAELGHW